MSINLTPNQTKAVQSDDPFLLVVAGAGSGKTEVVAHRLERLLRESPSADHRVLGLAYTLKASEELRERLNSRLGVLARRADTDTIHGFALSLLRSHGTQVGLPINPEVVSSEPDREALAHDVLESLGLPSHSKDSKQFLSEVDADRTNLTESPGASRWREALAEKSWLDFPAVLEAATGLVELPFMRRILPVRYQNVVVDEVQNLTAAQFAFIRALIGEPGHQRIPICVVGDERQSIFHFAGARPELIAEFGNDYEATRIELDVNFRSASAIRAFASLTDPTAAGVPDDRTVAPGFVGFHEASDESTEAAFVANFIRTLLNDGLSAEWCLPIEGNLVLPEQCGVLSRSGSALRRTAECLASLGIESSVASGADEWISTDEGRLVLIRLAQLGSPSHTVPSMQLRRAVTDCAGSLSTQILGLSSESLDMFFSGLLDIQGTEDWLVDLTEIERQFRNWRLTVEAADATFLKFANHLERVRRMEPGAKGVRLLTVHRAQGREFKAVFIVGCNEGQFPDFRAVTDAEQASERKTFYVAATRASRLLILTRAQFRETRFGPRATNPSPYLTMTSSKVVRIP